MKQSFQNSSILFFVMQIVQGGELKQLLDEKKMFPENIVKFYAVQLIDAVMDLHKRNLVHRDLKLENVLINQHGYLVIIDFGVSKKLEDNLKTGTMCGTLGNMAPELFSGGKYDKSIDWWAIGIMLYELLYGNNPFNKDDEDLSNMEFKDKVNNDKLEFPNEETNRSANDLIT